jgi:hypothetical protein
VLKRSLPICVACALLFSAGAAAAVKRVDTAWTDLGGLISSRKVSLVLPDGAAIEGRAVSIRPDTLTMSISKTSDPRAHPKGTASVPRASITTLQLLEMSVRGRVIGTALGVVGGLAVGAGIVLANGLFAKTSTGQNAGACVAIFGLPVAGFFAGRALDRKVTLIKITP